MYSDFMKRHIVDAEQPDSVSDTDIVAILNIVDTLLVDRTSTYTPTQSADGKITKFDDEFTGPSDLVVNIDFPADEVLGESRVDESDEIESCEFRRFQSYVDETDHEKNSTHVFRATSSITGKTYSIWISFGVKAVEPSRELLH